jgi:hypothetical protein
MRHAKVRDLQERGVQIWTEGGGPMVGISIVGPFNFYVTTQRVITLFAYSLHKKYH